MHLIVGFLVVVGTFLLSIEYMTSEFDGFLNIYSAILLGGVPIGLVFMSYDFSTIGKAFVGFFRALFSNADSERENIANDLVAFGREVRRDKGLVASTILERNGDPLFQHLGRHVLQKTDPEEIAADALIIGERSLQHFRAAERVLASLGDYAPAMGMIGTVIGLIQLLANMRDFEKLGPGMAIALLTTFYGLVLANLLYLPLSRLVGNYLNKRKSNMNLIIEGMLKLSRRRPIHEIQEVVGSKHQGAYSSNKANT